MRRTVIVAIDLGGQGIRCGLFTPYGDCLHTLQSAYELKSIDPARIEYPPCDLLAQLKTQLEQICHWLQCGPYQLEAAALAGQGSSFLCWHRQTGQPLSELISWRDQRGGPFLAQHPLSVDACESTGLPLTPYYGASKMRWCLDELAEVKQAAQQSQLCMGPVTSFIIWHLNKGHPCVMDPYHAQRTQLWDINNQRWSQPLLDHFGINANCLPEVQANHLGDISVGELSVPLRACVRDQGAVLFAAGLPQSETVYINLGTAGFIQCLSESKQCPPGFILSPIPASDDFPFVIEASIHGAMAQRPALEERLQTPLTAELITQALQMAESDIAVSFYVPEDGLGSPYWCRPKPMSLPDQCSPSRLINAWLDGVLFMVCLNLQRLLAYKPGCKRLQLSGGLAQYPGLCQRLADLSQLPVSQIHDYHATLRGAAWLALSAQQRQHWPKQQRQAIYQPQENFYLQQRFNQWNEQLQFRLKQMEAG